MTADTIATNFGHCDQPITVHAVRLMLKKKKRNCSQRVKPPSLELQRQTGFRELFFLNIHYYHCPRGKKCEPAIILAHNVQRAYTEARAHRFIYWSTLAFLFSFLCSVSNVQRARAVRGHQLSIFNLSAGTRCRQQCYLQVAPSFFTLFLQEQTRETSPFHVLL